MALPTLTDFLTSWDKLIVTGMTPERNDSVMTVAPNGATVTIEYRHQISHSSGVCSTIAYLVGYDSNGNRVTLRNQTYGCFGDEEKQFHQWFAKKMAGAVEMDARRSRDLSDGVDMVGIIATHRVPGGRRVVCGKRLRQNSHSEGSNPRHATTVLTN